MAFESEPLDAQQLSDEPSLPENPHEWPSVFIALVALIALIGLAATLFGISGKPIGNEPHPSSLGYITSGEQAALVLNSMLFIVCLAGLWLTRGTLLRTGFLLRVIALLGSILLSLPVVLIAFRAISPWMVSLYLAFFFLYSSPFLPLFEIALGILGVLSQIGFSYGLVRWQPSDKVFIWVQIAVTLGLGAVLLKTSVLPQNAPWFFVVEIASGAFLGTAALACFLLRPACWKANPLIVLCFTAGSVISLFFGEILAHFFHSPGSATSVLQISLAISLSSSTLFILGVLLLIRRARTQKKAQSVAGGNDSA